MNVAIITGRTVKDTSILKTSNDKVIGKLTVAVDTGYGENKETSYIPVTTFGKTAEFCEKYITKGRLVEVTGRMKTGSYEKKDGTKVPTFEVIAENIKALDKAKEESTSKEEQSDYAQLDSPDIPF